MPVQPLGRLHRGGSSAHSEDEQSLFAEYRATDEFDASNAFSFPRD